MRDLFSWIYFVSRPHGRAGARRPNFLRNLFRCKNLVFGALKIAVCRADIPLGLFGSPYILC